MTIELVKENIEYEQFVGQNVADTVVKEEYIIPDTEPDVLKILTVDAKPTILSKEVMQDKVYLEGQVDFNVLYIGKVEESTEVCGVSYSAKFSNYIELEGAAHKMLVSAEANVEQMSCKSVNERKIALEGIVGLKAEIYSQNVMDIVKDVAGLNNVQFLKNSAAIDKTVINTSANITAKSHIQIPMDRPQIENILKCDVNIHKKQVKASDGKIEIEAFAKFDVLYKGKDAGEVVHLYDDVLLNEDIEAADVTSGMSTYADFCVDSLEYNVKEDDLGENRNLEIEALLKADIKIDSKVDIDVIEDAYSPDLNIKIEKQNYRLNLVYGKTSEEAIVKENIEAGKGEEAPKEIMFINGKVSITDKKIVEDKVLVEGLVKTSVLYRCENNVINSIEEDLPFTMSSEIPGCKIDMSSSVNGTLESIEAAVEADTIGVKAILAANIKVNYNTYKDFLVNIEQVDEEKPMKKASITIYTAQAGDTLWKIAKEYYTTIEDIMRINNIESSDYILAGQKLIIPGRAIV